MGRPSSSRSASTRRRTPRSRPRSAARPWWSPQAPSSFERPRRKSSRLIRSTAASSRCPGPSRRSRRRNRGPLARARCRQSQPVQRPGPAAAPRGVETGPDGRRCFAALISKPSSRPSRPGATSVSARGRAQRLRNGGAFVRRTGLLLIGEMAPTRPMRAGLYFPSGTPDPNDIRAARSTSRAASRRELAEETGLRPGEFALDDGFTLVMDPRGWDS